jgi:hypothetical protein
MNYLIGLFAAMVVMLSSVACNTADPTAVEPGQAKAPGEVAWMGTGNGKVPFTVSWTDCDGN